MKSKKEASKEQIVREIIRAAGLYKQHLVGRTFLYVFDGRSIEVIYKAQNFRHLTGVDTGLPAKRFYQNAVNRTLQQNQIWFSPQHPYQLCLRKVKHLCEISTLAQAECFMLEKITTDSRSYKFGTTDLHFTLCLNKEADAQGHELGDCFVVQSLRDETCFAKSEGVYSVTHILARQNDKKLYTDLLYMDKKVSMQDIPADVIRRMDPALL